MEKGSNEMKREADAGFEKGLLLRFKQGQPNERRERKRKEAILKHNAWNCAAFTEASLWCCLTLLRDKLDKLIVKSCSLMPRY